MTILLEKAITRTVDLPPDKQDHLAEIILDALDDMEWDHKFAASQDFLASLADEGLADYDAGRTRNFKVKKEAVAIAEFTGAGTKAGFRP